MASVWKCQAEGCDYTTPPTLKGYERQTGHQYKHSKKGIPKGKRGISLIDASTKEVLARTPQEAREKGLLEPEPEPRLGIVVEPTEQQLQEANIRKYAEEEGITFEEAKARIEAIEPEPEPEPGAKKGAEVTIPQASTEGIFHYTITLPADAFTLFNLAKACGLEKDGDKPFDEFVWDCIKKRFETDYKVQLVLAPMEV
ncbi:hypothetical protein ES703_00151 [subsurface metagenome]